MLQFYYIEATIVQIYKLMLNLKNISLHLECQKRTYLDVQSNNSLFEESKIRLLIGNSIAVVTV